MDRHVYCLSIDFYDPFATLISDISLPTCYKIFDTVLFEININSYFMSADFISKWSTWVLMRVNECLFDAKFKSVIYYFVLNASIIFH